MSRLTGIRKIIVPVLLIVGCILSLIGCGSTENGDSKKEKIIVGSTCDTPKWSEQGSGEGIDKVSGYDADVFREIAKRNNWDIEWRIADFAGLLGMLDNDGLDTVANNVAINDQRKEKYNFSEPYAYDDYVFLVKKGTNIQNNDWVKGKKIAVVATFNARYVLEDKNKDENLGVDIACLDNTSAVIAELGSGACDGAFLPKSVAGLAVNELGMDMEMYNPNWKNLLIAFPFKKTEKEKKYCNAVDKSLKEMKADGTLTKISKKWFGTDISVK